MCYQDPKAAFRWLEAAFGFEPLFVLLDGDGCERARKAGAEILQEPQNQFYGDRTYRARDPEGHIWTFGVTEKKMTPQEWDKASGLTTKKRLE